MAAVAFCPDVPVCVRCAVALGSLCYGGFVQAHGDKEPSLQLEMSTLSTPAMQPPDGRPDARLTLTGWSDTASMGGIGVGLGVAVPSHQNMVEDGRQAAPGLDLGLGLHWRSADQGQGRVRIGVWQHVSPWPGTADIASLATYPINYNTRLEMQFSAASARGIQFELGGALGLQLNNNERVVLRVSRGRPMVYYRLKF